MHETHVCRDCGAEITLRMAKPPKSLPSEPDPNAVEVSPGTFLHWGLYLRSKPTERYPEKKPMERYPENEKLRL
jgi:hypothetical protein